MRYLFLIRVAEDASPSPEQADPEAWVEETTRRGQRLLGERLRSDSDAADDEEALAIAAAHPAASFGAVEVRAFWPFEEETEGEEVAS